MTQQQFADRIGKSKSWVDKVERGVRRLERVSNLREVAQALRIDLEVLVADRPDRSTPAAAGLEAIRTALARYHVETSVRPSDAARLRARLDHAEQAYRHARYPDLLALLPDLIDAARAGQVARPGRMMDGVAVSVYGLVALVLVKVDQGELGWLAADRAMAVALATDDPQVSAAATVPLCQALRACGRRRSAMEAAVVAAHQSMAAGEQTPVGAAVCATLLTQAALAAASLGNASSTGELLDQAEQLASGLDREGARRVTILTARVVADTALGNAPAAIRRHVRLTATDGWRWLPTEHRAAYLLDAARAYALTGDMRAAGRTILDAERTARSEVHDRPSVRDLIAVVARSPTAPADLTRLAATLHVT
ncbi:helix-turn-helix domain-containing protein [Micromonospora sp. SH-82]|uniref:helix-turn-helix domain-containing protein n=1 Tax=Micromonospora sp. SH-82 TaxID=3132938 RepID=UPI003EC0C4B3